MNDMVRRGRKEFGSDLEYGLAVARGKIPGVSVIHKFGHNNDIDTASGYEDVWNGGGEYTGFNATSAELVTIVSDSADDDLAGTGGRTLRLIGLAEDWSLQIELIELNGLTPVTSQLAYKRLDFADIQTAGSTGQNQGTITIAQSITTANVFAKMPPLFNRSLISCFTVPKGKQAYIISGFAVLSKKQAAFSNVQPLARRPGSVFQVAELFTINTEGTGYIQRKFQIPLPGLPEGTDLTFRADSSVNGMGISAGFEILLVDV